MSSPYFTYPAIDPVAFSLGPLQIHWYALAYLAGFLFGWAYIRWLARRCRSRMTPAMVDDFLSWAVLGVVLGGRLGYILFYNFAAYAENPLAVFKLWQGGMSFHGGLAGIIIALVLFARKYKLSPFHLGDLVAAAGPMGLFLGRLANFVNGELYGRPTTSPFGMVFPSAPDALPRHPSQLYEAGLEGILLFILLFLLATRTRALNKPGLIGGTFIAGYAVARFIVEFAREPDAQLGYFAFGLTMGQLLCVPTFLFGLWVMLRKKRALEINAP